MEVIEVRVLAVDPIAEGIRSLRLGRDDESPLPAYEPGAHIDLHLPSGRVRQYSLYGDPAHEAIYEIGVQVEPQGRGGSKEIFDALKPGDPVAISAPRNNFPLTREAERHVFVAGGIGITPIVPMLRAVERGAQPFQLIYCARAPERTAFLEYARNLAARDSAILHFDAGERSAHLDLRALLSDPVPGTHLYCCGPEGLMHAVREATRSWPTSTVHWEHFSNPGLGSASAADKGFKVRLARSGRTLEVPRDRSIIDVLRSSGIDVESSCESGLCGTCKTRYLSGTPDHRDLILGDTEQHEYIMICCSRSQSELLVLDL